MQQRKRNSAGVFTAVLLAAVLCIGLGVAEGFAANNPITVIDNQGRICPYFNGFTARIVNCIQGTVIWSVQNYLASYSGYFIATINVLAIFAVILFGFLALSGRAQATAREGFALAIKIGVVIFLVNFGAFGTIFPAIASTTDWLIGLVTRYTAVQLGNICPYSPFIWNRVDCALALIIGGILPGTTVASGLVGLVGTLLFSGGVGISLFFFGLAVILAVLLAMFQAMFILLSAYIALALLALLAPLMIPLMLFRATKAYFEKWLRLLIGVILQPLFLFAYLTIFLIALEVSIFTGPFSVYRSIACNSVDQPGFLIGNYLMGSGAVTQRSGAGSLASMVVGQNPQRFEGGPTGTRAQEGGLLGTEAAKATIDGGERLYNNGAGLSIDFTTAGIDIPWLAANCRMTPQVYFIRLLLSMFTAMAVVYIFYTMLQFIPYLGTLISGDLFGLPNLSKLMPTNALTGNQLAHRLGFRQGGQR